MCQVSNVLVVVSLAVIEELTVPVVAGAVGLGSENLFSGVRATRI